MVSRTVKANFREYSYLRSMSEHLLYQNVGNFEVEKLNLPRRKKKHCCSFLHLVLLGYIKTFSKLPILGSFVCGNIFCHIICICTGFLLHWIRKSTGITFIVDFFVLYWAWETFCILPHFLHLNGRQRVNWQITKCCYSQYTTQMSSFSAKKPGKVTQSSQTWKYHFLSRVVSFTIIWRKIYTSYDNSKTVHFLLRK